MPPARPKKIKTPALEPVPPAMPPEPALPFRRNNLVDLIHEELRRRITDRVLIADQRLVIDQLAAEFGTSLIPVREAMARLHAERLLVHEANKGYRVAPGPGADEMRNLFEARVVIEVGALRHGFSRIDQSTIDELHLVNRLIAKGRYGVQFKDFKAFIDLNARFHGIIVGLTANPFIIESYERLAYHQRISQTLTGQGPSNIDKIVADHDAVIAALRKRDREGAMTALSHHIEYGLEDALERARETATQIAGKRRIK